MRNTIFFDLDGTLLPFDMDDFAQELYMMMQTSRLLDLLDKDRGIDMFFKATDYMMYKDHPDITNKEAFFFKIKELSGVDRNVFEPAFDRFYREEFTKMKKYIKPEPRAKETVKILKEKNYQLVLATNPFFPRAVTEMRMEWGEIRKEDFMYITSYENCRYSKPDLRYFQDLLDTLDLKAKDCYMVGNTVEEDLVAHKLGFELFFLKDFQAGDLRKVPKCESGNYSDLLNWAKNRKEVK